ncbi:MAG: hypothetical protein ACP5NZ_05300 [Nanobdellota archaeon]
MKINFRKISAIAASALMTGMTMGVAAAANYPAPFVSGGEPNVAIVWGTGAGVSQLDFVQAGNIQESLAEYVTGGTVTVEGGEAFTLEKASDNFNLGDSLTDLYTTLDDGEMETFLADGTYDDGDVDEDYTQEITLKDKDLTLFAENDYNNEEPTLGFHWEDGDAILDYVVEYNDPIPYADLNESDIPLMGKEFYVISATPTVIELLDSAEKVVVSEGESVTVGDKTIEIEYVESGAVKFNVDGEITDTMADHDYEELADGSYIVANDIMYVSKESGISKVEFSIGSGKMTFTSGDEIEVNDEKVDGLTVTFTGGGATGLEALTFAWSSDDDTYLAEGGAVTMPEPFNSISLTFGGLTFGTDPEAITLSSGQQMNLEMGEYDLPLFWFDDDSATGAGYMGEENNRLVTQTTNLGAALTNASTGNLYNATALAHGGLLLEEDQRFFVTDLDTDLGDIDALYYEVTTIDYEDDELLVELEDLLGTNGDITLDDVDDAPTEGDVTIEIQQVNDTHIYLNFTGTSIDYNTVISEKGMKITLPEAQANASLNFATGQTVYFQEQDEDGDVGEGVGYFTATVKNTSNDKLHVSDNNVTSSSIEVSDDVELNYVVSELATKVTLDSTADEYDFDVEYYGEEATAEVKVVGGASTITPGESTLGNVIIKDNEVSNFATKNLIVVGGSCINSAAATLVGGAKCGAAWTAATGIGSGQFLIKGYADSTLTSELALLVAGYDAEDTVKATTYLLNKDVDTSKAYKGTTTTETAVVID